MTTPANIELALLGCESKGTRKVYEYALNEFAKWLKDREISYSTLVEYRSYLVRKDMTPQTINIRLAGIRFFLKEMAAREQMSWEQSRAACAVKSLKVKGKKIGNWLSVEKAQELLNTPDTSTLPGVRDRAALALMIGAGLRRSEIVALTVEHFEQRGERWVIVGIVGKGGRTRNVPIADWVKALIDAWIYQSGIKKGYIMRAVSESKENFWLRESPLDVSSLYYQVNRKYGRSIGQFRLAPHDLRRTAARLAYEGGIAIGQIQLMLGHTHQQITEQYINAQQNLEIAPSDKMGISIEL